MVLKIQIPNKLTDKQKELFMEIAKIEDKIVDTAFTASEGTEGKEKNTQDKGTDKGTGEHEKEDIFGKFRNMWGK